MDAPNNAQIDELSEDMEVVGPGQMLTEARIKLSLSVEDVVEKLKFQKHLVQNIEQDVFDQKLPATYNRGYLRAYANLVNIDVNEVLSAYDMLGVAEIQRSEMQSFSNLTEKQAEHSRLMWLSYLIVAILFGLMVLWWMQSPKKVIDEKNSAELQQLISQNTDTTTELNAINDKATIVKTEKNLIDNTETDKVKSSSINNENAEQALTAVSSVEPATQAIVNPVIDESKVAALVELGSFTTIDENQEPIIELSDAVFTFSGDCWVNIYDATGERIAWGVKKSGYVMTIKGKAPLKVTLGRPELAAIVFNGQPIDMSPFNVGNIAKFTLPINL